MSSIDNLFDINKILQYSFSQIESLSKDKKIELIFEMNSTLPREFRGDIEAIQNLLTTILTFVFTHTKNSEIVLCLDAPKDFLYEELVSFKIIQSGIAKEKILSFLKTELGVNLKRLEGSVVDDNNDIHVNIPFTIGELGFRRHYRLPLKSMLEKKVLLIVESESATRSIGKMFKYFPYDVDLGIIAFKEDRAELSKYDVVIIEDHLASKRFLEMIQSVKKEKNLKYVLLGNAEMNGCDSSCACLVKPVTQESIFELIVSLFTDDTFQKKITNKIAPLSVEVDNVADVKIPKSFQNKTEDSGINKIIEEKKSIHTLTLNIEKGLEYAKRKGVIYSQELENFLDTFEKSDLYFRQIVNEKQSNKIKEFCIDLEKQSKSIGAEGMQKFSDIISLIFVYNKLDMLPIYPGRYHIELEKLTEEIYKYLYGR